MRHDATESDAMRAYSCAAVAELLGVHRQTVHRWVTEGRLSAFDIGTPGRPRLRVTEATIRDFIAARQVDTA